MRILEISREGRVLRLVLNRPEKHNALNFELCRQLVGAVEEGARDSAVGAILLAGSGKSFCAGMDLSEMLAPAEENLGHIHEQLFTMARRTLKPIIASVQGAALAGGAGLVANAHIAIAAEGATFGLTEIRIGLWPFVIFRAMAEAIGERRTVELGLSGRVVDAREAAQFGLIHQVVSGEELERKSAEIAKVVAEASPEAIRSGLAFVEQSRGMSWDRAGEMAYRDREEVFRGADFAEGIRAFQEKRRPKWPSTE